MNKEIDTTIEELIENIRVLTIEEQAIKEEIAEKTKELENKRRDLLDVKDQRDKCIEERENAKGLSRLSSGNIDFEVLKPRDVVEIKNLYTKFSTWHKVKAIENSIKRNRNVRNYHKDKFGVVIATEKSTYAGRPFTKVHFITDSGKETWRKREYLKMHHGKIYFWLFHEKLVWKVILPFGPYIQFCRKNG